MPLGKRTTRGSIPDASGDAQAIADGQVVIVSSAYASADTGGGDAEDCMPVPARARSPSSTMRTGTVEVQPIAVVPEALLAGDEQCGARPGREVSLSTAPGWVGRDLPVWTLRSVPGGGGQRAAASATLIRQCQEPGHLPRWRTSDE